MKTVLFDLYEAQPVGTSKFHGGGEYIKAVYKFLVDNCLDKCELIVFYNDQKFIDDWILDSFNNTRIKTEIIYEREEISKIFLKYSIDIFYSGIPYHYRRDWFPKNVVIKGTIHGLRDIEMPCDRYTYMYYRGISSCKQMVKALMTDIIRKKKINEFSNCIELLDEVVCVSKHTQYSLMSTFPGLVDKKMMTCYTPSKYVEERSTEKKIINGKYIFIMGCDRWIKNSYRAFIALGQIIEDGLLGDYKIVALGKIPAKIRTVIKKYEAYFQEMDYVSGDELEILYKDCDFFIYPSLNEGFGMPPLEAMKYGKTCIVSGVCSLTEVCGDVVYYVNPYDINEIKTRILEAMHEKISEEKIKSHLLRIQETQSEHLEKLCNFIIK